MKASLISSYPEFTKLRSEWNTLLKKSNANNFFLTWEWMDAWWQVYGKNKELFIVKVEKNEKIVGLAPLYKGKRRLGLISATQIEFMGAGESCPDHLDFILDQEYEQEIIQKIDELFEQEAENIDFIFLESLLPTSFVYKTLISTLQKKGFKAELNKCTVCPYLELPQTTEEFYKNLSRKTRQRVRKISRDLQTKTDISVTDWSEMGSVKKNMELLSDINTRRWNKKGLQGNFQNEKFLEFITLLSEKTANNGWLDLKYFLIEKTPVAYSCNFAYDNRIYGYSAAFRPDEEYSKYRPGFFLMTHLILKAVSEGFSEIDMLRGANPYKYQFTKTERVNYSARVYKPKAKFAFYFALRAVISLVRKPMKKIIPESMAHRIGKKLLSFT